MVVDCPRISLVIWIHDSVNQVGRLFLERVGFVNVLGFANQTGSLLHVLLLFNQLLKQQQTNLVHKPYKHKPDVAIVC